MSDFHPANGLHVDVIGSPTVLNNGNAPNTVTIGLTNNNLMPAVDKMALAITLTPDCKFSLWFVVDDKQVSAGNPDRSWALTTIDQLYASQLNIILPDGADDTANWKIETNKPEGNPLMSSLAGWLIVPRGEFKLLPGDSLRIQLSGLITNIPDGVSVAYYSLYHPDLDREISSTFGPLVKTRMVSRNKYLGIDTVDPGSMLDVRGGIRTQGGPPGAWGANDRGYFFSTPGDEDSGMSSSAQGNLEFYINSLEAVRFVHDGTNIETVFMGNLKVAGHTGEKQNPKDGAENNAKGNLEVAGDLTVTGNVTGGTGVLSVGGDLKTTGRIKDQTGFVMPVGAIIAYGGSRVPDGWLLCDGSKRSKNDYPDLSAALGTLNLNGSNFKETHSLGDGFAFTISMWINPEKTDGNLHVFDSEPMALRIKDGYLVLLLKETEFRNHSDNPFYKGPSLINFNCKINAGESQHVTISKDEYGIGGLKLYINGNLANSDKYEYHRAPESADILVFSSININLECKNIVLGQPPSPDKYEDYQVQIIDFRFIDKELSSEEIKTEMNPDFFLPDLRDRFIVGAGSGYKNGETGGEKEHTLTISEMPKHRHGFLTSGSIEDGYIGDWGDTKKSWNFKMTDRIPFQNAKPDGLMDSSQVDSDDMRPKSISFAGDSQPHNNLPPYYALTYIIKY